MKRVTAFLLFALLGACDDGPAAPKPVSDVEILLNAVPVDGETLTVGETTQLSASLFDGNGRPFADRRATWRSTVPAVARVDTTGLVTAVSPGEALVIASADAAADTVRIAVQARIELPPQLDCASGTTTLNLAVGEVVSLSAQQQPLLCLDGAGGSEYTLIPFHAAATTARLAVDVAASGVTAAVGPPNPSRLPAGAAARLALSGRSAEMDVPLDRSVDLRLRDWERRNFAARRASAAARGGLAPSFSRAGVRAVPSVGDTLHLNVNADQACTDPDLRVARVEAVTEHAIVVADTTNPQGGFSRDEYRAFGVTFDTLVWKVDVANFGEPQDLDRNEKVLIFFTGAVNALSEANSGSVVGGFFFGRDLFERSGTGTRCAGSNQGELFYMLVPDPEGTINQNRRSKGFVAGSTVAVLAHEFQHLINFSRRLFVNDALVDEETWLNEGLSHIAEELVFYEAASLQPELNLGINDLRNTTGVFAKFVEYQWSNFGRFVEYLENPANASPLADDDELSTRGATWAFLRYAADRKSDAGVARDIWFNLVNSRTSGVQNLQAVFGVDPLSWLEDWTVSVYTDDAGLPVAPRYLQPSWDFRSILGPGGVRSASSGQPIYPVFPLQTVALRSGTENQRSFSLQGGGAAFLRFGVAAGDKAAIRVGSGGQVPPGSAAHAAGEDPMKRVATALAALALMACAPRQPEPPDSAPAPVAGGEGRVMGTLRVVGSAPVNDRLVLRPDEGGSIQVVGPLADELRALSGAQVALSGPMEPAADPMADRQIRVSDYEILAVNGEPVVSGTLEGRSGDWLLLRTAGGELVYLAGATGELRPGQKVWVQGPRGLIVQSFGVLRD